MIEGRVGFVALALGACAFGASAQESPAREKLELRVIDSTAGSATVDRGSLDGLRAGDRVVLRPREGLPLEGRVAELGERSARVEFDDGTRSVPPGTRGEAWVVRAAAPAPQPEPAAPADRPAVPAHPAWPPSGEDWKQGMPLLNEVVPLHPGQRAGSAHGRWYLIADHVRSVDGTTSYGFDRAGLDVTYTNPFGNGAELHIAGELDARSALVPDADDEHEAYVRLDRLSYVIGGNRFEPERWEFGRFLQQGMPEFGVLDGVDWSRRTSGGDSFGASVGYLPEPDFQQDSFRDLALAGWYRWVADESERAVFQVGVQKSFHEYSSDRDLAIARLDLGPRDGWSLHGSCWVDYYTAGDTAKGAGLEITQASVLLEKRFDGGSTLALSGTHVAIPEIDHWEFPATSAAALAKDHSERVALRGRQNTGRGFWLREEVGAWADQDDQGGDVESGLELEDVLFDGGRARFSGFVTEGRTDHLWGTRASLGRQLASGSWELAWEFAHHDMAGFSSANDEIPQQHVRLSRDFHTSGGWSFSAHAEWIQYANEDSIAAGIYLQRSF